MQEIKQLGVGLSAGALTMVVFLLLLLSEGRMHQVEALLQQEPKQLTANEYVNTMMPAWSVKTKRSNSVVATVE